MIYIGIDPGKSGAMAVISGPGVEDNGKVLDILNFDLEAYRECLVRTLKLEYSYSNFIFVPYKIAIEQVHAMPGQGVTSMFHFGENFGQICGLLTGLGLKYECVTPMKWKKCMGVSSDKQTSIQRALEYFPDAPLMKSKRSRVPDNNRAEALLLALFGRDYITK